MVRQTSAVLPAASLVALLALVLPPGGARGDPPSRYKEKIHIKLSGKDSKWLKALNGRDPRERERAIRQLAYARDPSLVPVLSHYVAYDSDQRVREAAAAAVGRLRASGRFEPPEWPPVRRGRELVDERYSDERERVDQAWEAVEVLKTSRRAYQREEAARTLGRLGGARAIDALAYAASYDPDVTVRNVASRAIHRIRGRDDDWRPPPPPRYEVEEVDRPPIEAPTDRTVELIENAAAHYLGRRLEPRAMRDWVNHFERGGTYFQMLAGFLNSDEYFRRAGSDPARWIHYLYTDVLRREPSAHEMQTWLGVYQRVGGVRHKLLDQWLQGAEQGFREGGFAY